MNIEITIPVLNEEDTLERQVLEANSFVQQSLTDLGDIKIVIADNGSTDATASIAKRLASRQHAIKFVQVPRAGVGLALKTSWGQSNADIVGYMDLDLATDLEYLRPALEPLVKDEMDIITGSRLKHGAKVIGRSLVRAITTRVFNKMLRVYLGAKFTDGMCGFKFLQRKHLAALRDAGAVSDGWFFATELLVCAEYLGLRLLDLPVTWTDDPNSKAKIGKLAVQYIAAMRKLRAKHGSAPTS